MSTPADEKPDNDEKPDDDDKGRIISEEAKQRQVSHWDMDYLPKEELERRMKEGEEAEKDEPDSDS